MKWMTSPTLMANPVALTPHLVATTLYTLPPPLPWGEKAMMHITQQLSGIVYHLFRQQLVAPYPVRRVVHLRTVRGSDGGGGDPCFVVVFVGIFEIPTEARAF